MSLERGDGGRLFSALRRLCQRYYTADSQGRAPARARHERGESERETGTNRSRKRFLKIWIDDHIVDEVERTRLSTSRPEQFRCCA